MGHNATMVISMDLAHLIKDDSKFGEKVYNAALRVVRGEPVSIDNVAAMIDCHHADWYQVMIVGNNSAIVPKSGTNWQRDDTEDDVKLRVLKELAEELGYRVSKKTSSKQ